MKYSEGNILALNDGRTVYVMHVNKTAKKYQVFDTENENDIFEITDNEVLMKLV